MMLCWRLSYPCIPDYSLLDDGMLQTYLIHISMTNNIYSLPDDVVLETELDPLDLGWPLSVPAETILYCEMYKYVLTDFNFLFAKKSRNISYML